MTVSLTTGAHADAPAPGTQGRFVVISTKPPKALPAATVDLLIGPAEAKFTWWQLEARTEDPAAEPLFQLQVLASRDPVTNTKTPLEIDRYILRIPETGEILEYRNIHTQKAMLPPWKNFLIDFFPKPVEEGVPHTCTYLGHVLALHEIKSGVAWEPLKPTKVLDLDPELLIGTSRPFKDKEEKRLPQTPQRQNYTYVNFDEADYKVMIEAGINLYTVAAEQEKFVRSEPVFYVRSPGGNPPMRYPADLYRGNYVGAPMFMDEPASIMSGEAKTMGSLRRSLDAVAVLQMRVREDYRSEDGIYALDRLLRQDGNANLGDMRIERDDLPIWETLYDTTYYQVAVGGSGLIYEARFQLEQFDRWVAEKAGIQRKHTPEEIIRYHYAFLRGGTRPFGKYWGTSIYGQCDPKISPLAMSMAYDMGARYLWYWTSDHDHHMPWPEQLELTRGVRKHIAKHPRRSISEPLTTRDLAIVLPYGSFPSLYSAFDLGDRTLLKKLQPIINEAFDQKLDFDITVDDGREITGYRRVLRVAMDGDGEK